MKAVCLHANQSVTQRQKMVDLLKSGKIHILLLSPESVVSSGPFGLTSLLRQLPPVAFVCIDEAHCVSQWSHNFRPSYLRICKVPMPLQTFIHLFLISRPINCHHLGFLSSKLKKNLPKSRLLVDMSTKK